MWVMTGSRLVHGVEEAMGIFGKPMEVGTRYTNHFRPPKNGLVNHGKFQGDLTNPLISGPLTNAYLNQPRVFD